MDLIRKRKGFHKHFFVVMVKINQKNDPNKDILYFLNSTISVR
jgi:hypothetical protein